MHAGLPAGAMDARSVRNNQAFTCDRLTWCLRQAGILPARGAEPAAASAPLSPPYPGARGQPILSPRGCGRAGTPPCPAPCLQRRCVVRVCGLPAEACMASLPARQPACADGCPDLRPQAGAHPLSQHRDRRPHLQGHPALPPAHGGNGRPPPGCAGKTMARTALICPMRSDIPAGPMAAGCAML